MIEKFDGIDVKKKTYINLKLLNINIFYFIIVIDTRDFFNF